MNEQQRRRWRRRWKALKEWVSSAWDRTIWPIEELGRKLWKLVRSSPRRFREWWALGSSRYLFQGLPALLVGAGALTVALLVVLVPRGESVSWYQQIGYEAMSAKEFPCARIAFERLAQQDAGRAELRYYLALSEESLGNLERSWGLMSALALLNREGYGPAHLWLANHSAGTHELTVPALEAHLLRGLQQLPDDAEGHALLARLYLQTNRANAAEPHLLKAVQTRPALGVRLAVVYKQQGKTDLARQWAQRSVSFFRARAEANLDAHAARALWAEATLLLDDFPAAVAILQDGYRLATVEVRQGYRPMLAHAYVLWFDSLKGDREEDAAKRLTLLEEAIDVAPRNGEVLDRFSQATRVAGPEADKARAILQSLLAQGKASAGLHLALAMDAHERGKAEIARQHLDQAYRLNPDMPIVANNLAWMLANRPPVDLPRALEMMNTVIERYPREPNFRETRGEILVKMARYTDALNDLQLALRSLPNDPGVHAALAEAYEQTGNTEMAAQHRRLAEKKGP